MKKWAMSYWLALKYSLPHLKAIIIKALKVFGAITLIELLLLVGFYFLQSDWLFEHLSILCVFQVIAILVAFPLVLISIVSSYRPHVEYLFGVIIWIWQGKAYLPTLAETETPGLFVNVDPVYLADLTPSSLTEAMTKVKEAGHQPEPTSPEGDDPLLTITKAANIEALHNESTVFVIKWTTGYVELELVEAKKKSPQRLQTFPPDVSLDTISETILTNIKN